MPVPPFPVVHGGAEPGGGEAGAAAQADGVHG